MTLGREEIAYFPDAVSSRGTKHLRLLQELKKQGHRAVMFYVVQREDCKLFKPADHIDPTYGQTLRKAHTAGVEIIVYQAKISLDEISLTCRLPWKL